MDHSAVASVAIESPVPQLDRLFDYSVPSHLKDQVAVGVRVMVPFGRAAKLVSGLVVSCSASSDFSSKLSDIDSCVSTVPVLQSQIYELARAVADRQCSSLFEVLKLAIPKRSVRVETKWLEQQVESDFHSRFHDLDLPEISFRGKLSTYHGKIAVLAEPRRLSLRSLTEAKDQEVSAPFWSLHFVAAAIEQLALGKSSILVVPDYRDIDDLLKTVDAFGLSDRVANFSSEQTPSMRYSAFLKTLSGEPVVVVGSRAAIWAPVRNLGSIMLWDDLDQNLHETAAPYIHTREVALMRQRLQDCNLLFAGHSRSAEIQRLVQIGYLNESESSFAPPRIIATKTQARIDSTTYGLARKAFESGGSVLVQVSATGHTQSLYCNGCQSRAICGSCHGPLFTASDGATKCRWCSALALSYNCLDCGSSELRMGSAGSSRTASELGKSFPGVQVIESTHDKRVMDVSPGKKLVVATAGCEPRVAGGYALVVLLDANRALAKDTLRASEYAVRNWANACSMVSVEGQIIAVGFPDSLARDFAVWKQIQLAQRELNTRRELGFPPAIRFASVTGPLELLNSMIHGLADAIDAGRGKFEVLGPFSLGQDQDRYLIRFDYAVGNVLAKELRARSLKISAGNVGTSAKTGRTTRLVKIKMDDPEVV